MIALLAAATLAAQPIDRTDIGKAGSACRPGEEGPAFLVDIEGLKDRAGRLKVEIYPGTDEDLLGDDATLVAAGKVFRRVEVPVPPAGPVELCIRTPGHGMLAVVVLHDRNLDHRLTIATDGVGFSRNPKLGWSKPRAATVAVAATPAPTRLRIVLNYHHGLFGFGPLR